MNKGDRLHLVLFGCVPSKKNSRKSVRLRGGKNKGMTIFVPNARYNAWHSSCAHQMRAANVPFLKLEKVHIHVIFFQPDVRKRDLSNQFESVADLLVDYGLLIDDNCFVVTKQSSELGGVDREDPRAEVIITKR